MKFSWCLKNKIDKLLVLAEVALEVEWADLRDVELKITSLLRLKIWVDAALG